MYVTDRVQGQETDDVGGSQVSEVDRVQGQTTEDCDCSFRYHVEQSGAMAISDTFVVTELEHILIP